MMTHLDLHQPQAAGPSARPQRAVIFRSLLSCKSCQDAQQAATSTSRPWRLSMDILLVGRQDTGELAMLTSRPICHSSYFTKVSSRRSYSNSVASCRLLLGVVSVRVRQTAVHPSLPISLVSDVACVLALASLLIFVSIQERVSNLRPIFLIRFSRPTQEFSSVKADIRHRLWPGGV
jgi:hypothetical protein